MDADVAILGGGFAGLAAAGELQRHDYRVLLFEARDRLGGRALTIPGDLPMAPLELGGEFVHGRPAVTLDVLRSAGTTDVDNGDESWTRDGTAMRRNVEDPITAATRLLARALERDGDESVEALCRRLGSVDGARDAAGWARLIVAGFDAADPARASARAIAAEWAGDAGADDAQSRPLGGYGPLVSHLARALHPERSRLLLSTAVRKVTCREGGVDLDVMGVSGEATYAARRAIVTLPLGVLQAPPGVRGAIAFEPILPREKRAALAKLVMGPVRKVVLKFATPFWETLHDGRYREGAFFYSGDAAFPVYWTQTPVRSGAIVAWAGGPSADKLAALDDDAVAILARDGWGTMLDALADARAAYLGYATHDWQRDACFRGAYSYVAVGGEGARAELARSVDRILYFAGEATASDGEGGTVAGALQSGIRAAREVHAAALEAGTLARP